MKIVQLILTATFLVFLSCQSDSSTKENATTENPVAENIADVEVKKAIPPPRFADIDVAEFKEKMKGDNVVIMDVRTPEEISQGKIEGAIEIDILEGSFGEKVKDMDKDKTYLIYCRSGNRSGKACNAMAGMGFKDLYNLKGGFTVWSEAK